MAQVGQRRTGKTYLMKLIEMEAEEKGFNAISVNLEDAVSTEKAIAKISQAITDKGIQGVYDNFLARVKNLLTGKTGSDSQWQDLAKTPTELIRILIKQDWKNVLDQLLSGLDQAKKPTLLLIDELSVCLLAIIEKDKSKGNEFLHTLRALRQDYTNVIWMITGSIGLHAIEKNYGLDGTNDLHIFMLNPLEKEQAKALLLHECQKRHLNIPDEKTTDYFIQRLGWLSPHYLLKLLDMVEDLSFDTRESNITNALIDEACQQMISFPYNRIFNNWTNHIDRNYPNTAHKQAKAILKVLSNAPSGKDQDGLLSHTQTADIPEKELHNTLRLLVEDGFIVYDKQSRKYDFQFGLLKDFWHEYEGA